MKRSARYCLIAAGCLLVCFVISMLMDLSRYNSETNSAPFTVWILVRAIEFLLPAAVLLVIAAIIQFSKKK